MARNPMKVPGLPKNPFGSSLPSDKELSPNRLIRPPMAPVPGITRPEKPIDPEGRKERFRKLMGVLRSPKTPGI